MFDSQAYVATLEAPSFKDQSGRVHRGRILGADHWQSLQHKLRVTRKDGTVDGPALNRAMIAIVDSVFPRSRWWRFWERRVSWWIWQLPYEGRVRAVWSFMESQAKATGMSMDPYPGTFPTT